MLISDQISATPNAAVNWIEIETIAADDGAPSYLFRLEETAGQPQYKAKYSIRPIMGAPRPVETTGGATISDVKVMLNLVSRKDAARGSNKNWGVLRWQRGNQPGTRPLSQAEWLTLKGTMPFNVYSELEKSYLQRNKL